MHQNAQNASMLWEHALRLQQDCASPSRFLRLFCHYNPAKQSFSGVYRYRHIEDVHDVEQVFFDKLYRVFNLAILWQLPLVHL